CHWSQDEPLGGEVMLHLRDSSPTQGGSDHVLGLGFGLTQLGIRLGSVRPSGSGRSVGIEVGSCDFDQSPVTTFMPGASLGLRSSCYFHLKAQVYLGPGAPMTKALRSSINQKTQSISGAYELQLLPRQGSFRDLGSCPYINIQHCTPDAIEASRVLDRLRWIYEWRRLQSRSWRNGPWIHIVTRSLEPFGI